MVTFVTMAGLSDSKPSFQMKQERKLGEVRKGFTHFSEGDVLFAKITPCMENGKGAVATGLRNRLGCGTTELHVIRPRNGVNPYYLYRFLSQASVRRAAKDSFTGTAGQARVPTAFITELEVPLAPPAEQLRIADKLEKLLAQVDAARERVSNFPILLKRIRQSILDAACSGRLTADWRGDNTGAGELPVTWRRLPLEEILPNGGIFDGPFGSNLKTSDYTTSGVRVIRLENVGKLRFIAEKESFISRQEYASLNIHTVGEGDIIFASFIDDGIRACILPLLQSTAIAKADCFCLRPRADMVVPCYLAYQLVSQESYDPLIEEVHGATRPRINTTQLRRLKVRICPINEQKGNCDTRRALLFRP